MVGSTEELRFHHQDLENACKVHRRSASDHNLDKCWQVTFKSSMHILTRTLLSFSVVTTITILSRCEFDNVGIGMYMEKRKKSISSKYDRIRKLNPFNRTRNINI